MNYYEHHLGDWAAATGHLTWDEDMAYTRLLRAYYHAEKAIAEGQQYRLAKASTPAQRKAVDAVLAEFFILKDGAYRQKRADVEIARYQDKQRKAKASANARWSQSGRNANASPDAMRTHSEGNAHQTPDTRHQSKTNTEDHHHLAGGRAHERDLTEVVGTSKPTQAGAICAALRRAGIGDANPGHPRLLTLIAAGATEAEFTGFASAALGKSAGFAWVLGAVENERKRALAASKQIAQGVMPTRAAEPAWMAQNREFADVLTGRAKRAASVAAPFTEFVEVLDGNTRRLG